MTSSAPVLSSFAPILCRSLIAICYGRSCMYVMANLYRVREHGTEFVKDAHGGVHITNYMRDPSSELC